MIPRILACVPVLFALILSAAHAQIGGISLGGTGAPGQVGKPRVTLVNFNYNVKVVWTRVQPGPHQRDIQGYCLRSRQEGGSWSGLWCQDDPTERHRPMNVTLHKYYTFQVQAVDVAGIRGSWSPESDRIKATGPQ